MFFTLFIINQIQICIPWDRYELIHANHQSVSLENKTGDSIVLKIGDSAKVLIKQDMKGRNHKYGFNNNKREKTEKKRVVDDETGNKHKLYEVLRIPSKTKY